MEVDQMQQEGEMEVEQDLQQQAEAAVDEEPAVFGENKYKIIIKKGLLPY
jgi:hypothetical protein